MGSCLRDMAGPSSPLADVVLPSSQTTSVGQARNPAIHFCVKEAWEVELKQEVSLSNSERPMQQRGPG